MRPLRMPKRPYDCGKTVAAHTCAPPTPLHGCTARSAHWNGWNRDLRCTRMIAWRFPRARTYRVWVQFQRKGVINTAHFDVPVSELK